MYSNDLPLVAILRGITLSEVGPISNALYEAGIRYIEIPLNSPTPFDSIAALIELQGERAICGAGTVTTVEEVTRLAECGAKLIVSPHIDTQIVEAALARDMLVMPGVATITEALTAIKAGATHLKLFPAGDLGAGYLKSINAVIPVGIKIFAVGNIGLADLTAFTEAGACGFGIGGGIYRPGMSATEVFDRAKQYVSAVEACIVK
tara:strand:- start:10 stop:627 length:618 start_codon:yes stop_codon:yes gene_type:complete